MALHAQAEQHLAAQRWADAYRQHMRALAGGGERAAALAVYQRCMKVLNDDLGIVPDDQTICGRDPYRGGQASGHSRTARATPDAADAAGPVDSAGRARRRAEADHRAAAECRDPACHAGGVGSAGKTRLALAAAWGLRETFADGVGWVSQAGIGSAADPALQSDALAVAVGAALGLAFDGRRVPLDELRHSLAGRDLLLVLDNMDAVDLVVERWAHRSP